MQTLDCASYAILNIDEQFFLQTQTIFKICMQS